MSLGKKPCRVMLLDLENVPKELSRLAGEMPRFQKVIACHGITEPKLPLDVAKQLAPVIHKGQLEFVSMVRSGKNAADFGIAFLAGKLMVQLPPDTEFVILSKDTGLDHVVDMLKRYGREAKRVAALRQPSQEKVPDKKTKTPRKGKKTADRDMQAAVDFCDLFLDKQLNRPRRRATLLNAISSFFEGRQQVDSEKVLMQLIQLGVVKLDEKGRVRYQVRSPKPPTLDAREVPKAEEPKEVLEEAEDFADEADTVLFDLRRADLQKTFQWHSR